MKSIQLLLLFVLFTGFANAQEKFITKQGYISFFSHSPVEDIKADNNQVLSIIDTSTGDIAVSLLMQSFIFEKSLMQEHFNENYIESHKYPKAVFKGKILDFENAKGNDERIVIEGDLTIRGITKAVQAMGEIKKMGDTIVLSGNFDVKVEDYDIKIPAIVVNNIAKTINVTFKLDHQPYN